ncbi:SOS response-associated peptidase [Luminiphilus syltensis]|uniref:SOS response-associated peptidase n=1 Tax=Luminiphilus syltensis TaxID=1341119 RepID=UPI001E61E5B6|nr:SOS response-associated peptidase [Luminiphilus syltensis]
MLQTRPMCGRYVLTVNNRPELKTLGIEVRDRFNIAPQTEVLVLDETETPVLKPWDYSPSWADPAMHLINARSETLRQKPAFRGAKRCVFLADGWYEWHRDHRGKTPYYHHLGQELLYFAGIYNETSGCAIVTREAHDNLQFVHHRQPVLLESRAVPHWLEGHDLFASAISHQVECYPVSQAVNSPGNDGPSLIDPRQYQPTSSPTPALGESGDLFD